MLWRHELAGHNVLRGMAGKVFGKTTVTTTIAGDEPMVILDAAAITQRIGSISHPEKPAAPVLQPFAHSAQPAQPRWRAYLRNRTGS